jgi:hypothetical protein
MFYMYFMVVAAIAETVRNFLDLVILNAADVDSTGEGVAAGV